MAVIVPDTACASSTALAHTDTPTVEAMHGNPSHVGNNPLEKTARLARLASVTRAGRTTHDSRHAQTWRGHVQANQRPVDLRVQKLGNGPGAAMSDATGDRNAAVCLGMQRIGGREQEVATTYCVQS